MEQVVNVTSTSGHTTKILYIKFINYSSVPCVITTTNVITILTDCKHINQIPLHTHDSSLQSVRQYTD